MNARGILAAVVVAVLVAFPRGAQSQEVNLATLNEGSPNRVHVRTGAEYGLVAGLGYSRVLSFLDRVILLGGDLTAPWAGFDGGDYQVRASALVPIVDGQRWKLAGIVAPTLRATRNDAGRMISLGVDAGAVGGYYAPGWFAAGELGFDWRSPRTSPPATSTAGSPSRARATAGMATPGATSASAC